MIEYPECPICRHESWRFLEKKTYKRSELTTDTYLQIRREVLFNLWFPEQEIASLESILCDACGFVCYRPRPEEGDIGKKYTYLAEHELASKEFSLAKASDKSRSRELYDFITPYLGDKKRAILDYGGGNGRLLQDFLDNGHQCSIVELVNEVLPGINYVGKDISDAIELGHFEIIICSHVLEHVVDPVATILQLCKALEWEGLVYIEVPNELWRHTPPRIEPVTHINFFSTDSLRTLLGAAGLEIIYCEYKTFIRPNGLAGIAIKAIGKKTQSGIDGTAKLNGHSLALSQINAGFIGSFFRILRHPRLIANLFCRPAP